MAMWTVCEAELRSFLGKGAFPERFVSVQGAGGARFARMTDELPDPPAIRSPRAPMSAKPFCFPPDERVARYPEPAEHRRFLETPLNPPASGGTALVAPAPRLVVGVRACELVAMAYLDRVFGHAPVSDPFYQARRTSATLISVDCIQPHETCFCTLVGGLPYATGGFDINLTPIEGSYLVEAGSEAGQTFIDEASGLLSPASPSELAARDRVRQSVVERLMKANADYAPTRSPEEALAQAEDSPIWDGLAKGCVECGACTSICPTCHCFYLLEQSPEQHWIPACAGMTGTHTKVFERLRAWDSCVWSGYSRMAGATMMKPNPRSRFRSRFANRFLHKYVWSPKQWGMLGCVGCGRCIEACPGRIDLRRVVREVSA